MRKAFSGIEGLDEITNGGLPYARPTLICGGPGCGKSTLAMEFLIKGAKEIGEPGVLFSFEESEDDIIKDFLSLHPDLPGLIEKGLIYIEYVDMRLEGHTQVGPFTLDALFLRIDSALNAVKGRRIVFDTIEALLWSFPDKAFLRNEIQRLFTRLKEREVTTIITGEAGEHALTRWGIEEYVTDCVISIDHRIVEQASTRRLRIVKYRGSAHGTNEYPFLISEKGVSVIPITSSGLDYSISSDRVSSGLPDLDTMLKGKSGYYKGSSVLISGMAGCGKSSVAAAFATSVCASGDHCLYFSFEESPSQIIRNMGSIGIDLQHWVDRDLLTIKAERPTMNGLEHKLFMMISMVDEIRPSAVVIDPITNLINIGSGLEVKSMLTRFIDILKTRHITILMTHLNGGSEDLMETQVGISSIMDTWIALFKSRTVVAHTRLIEIIKARGMNHCEETRRFVLTDRGIFIDEIEDAAHE